MITPKVPTYVLPGGSPLPLLGLGTWQLEGTQAVDAVAFALDIGYRHVDTATGYSNEAEVGRGLVESGVARTLVFVTTKCPPENVGHERETIQQSLNDLALDYVDLWLVHWPPNGEARPETWREFIRARDDELVREIGVSKVEGTIAHGSRIAVHRAALPGRVLHVRVTELVENLQMAWTSGRASALFRSVRTFTLKQTAGGGTEVVVEEDFRGPLTRVMRRSVPDLQPLFEQFIVGLKAQVEGHA